MFSARPSSSSSPRAGWRAERVYVPQDPGAPDDLAKHGLALFDFGGFWFKGQHMSTGRCPVKRYNRHLRNLIAQEKV